MGVYAWLTDPFVTQSLNQTNEMNKVKAIVTLPPQVYSVYGNGRFSSIEYVPKEFKLLALVRGPSTSRFTNDIAAEKVDYVTWGQGLYKVVHLADIHAKMDRSDLKEREVFALISVPSIAEVRAQMFIAPQESFDKPIIQGFITSTETTFPATIPKMMQVIGYKV